MGDGVRAVTGGPEGPEKIDGPKTFGAAHTFPICERYLLGLDPPKKEPQATRYGEVRIDTRGGAACWPVLLALVCCHSFACCAFLLALRSP